MQKTMQKTMLLMLMMLMLMMLMMMDSNQLMMMGEKKEEEKEKDMLREKSNNPNLKGGEQPQPEGWGKMHRGRLQEGESRGAGRTGDHAARCGARSILCDD